MLLSFLFYTTLILWCIYYCIRHYRLRYVLERSGHNKPVARFFNVPFFSELFSLIEFQALYRTKIQKALIARRDRCGKNWYINFPIIGSPLIIGTSDPDVVKEMLTARFSVFKKSPRLLRFLSPIFGKGIFAVNDSLWKLQRKTAAHLFSVNMLRSMLPIFRDHTKHLCKQLSTAAATGAVIDAQALFAEFTLASIFEIGFGVRVDSEGLRDGLSFGAAFNDASILVGDRFGSILWALLPERYEWILRQFPSERHLTRCVEVVDSVVYAIIEARKKEPKEALEERTDVLSRYLLMKYDAKVGAEEELTDKHLRDFVLNLMLAGRDTTAITLSCMLMHLSGKKLIQQRLLDEIDALGTEEPTYEQLKNDMPYMRATIDETLRLCPPVYCDPKFATEDATMSNGMFVPKGTILMWDAWAMGRSDDHFPNCLEFKPERWLDARENGGVEIKRDYYHIPFQNGPRRCLGEQMAYAEIKSVLCDVLPKFELTMAPNATVEWEAAITLLARHGISMHVKERTAE